MASEHAASRAGIAKLPRAMSESEGIPYSSAAEHEIVWVCAANLRNGLVGRDFSDPAKVLRELCAAGLDRIPLPGKGRTLERWRALAAVSECDLSLAKFYEGHTDALAILAELEDLPGSNSGVWGVWAAEAPQARVSFEPQCGDQVRVSGRKAWCSGAGMVDHGLLTVWCGDRGPFLAAVDMRASGVSCGSGSWHAVGMAATASADVDFSNAIGHLVGGECAYLQRPGFWQGGAGIAACWFGAATALAEALRSGVDRRFEPHAAAYLGAVDVALGRTRALLRETAAWIDANPQGNAMQSCLRVRAAAEEAARCSLDLAGRGLGATPYCRDARFARLAADLPVFLRQSHAERDLEQLGREVARQPAGAWSL